MGMHRNLISIAFLLTAICMVQFAGAQTAATPPATQPAAAALNCRTPMAFMTSYDSLAGQDPPAYLALYSLSDDPDVQRLAKAQAKFDAQVGMLQKIVGEKWGDDAVDQMLHALGLKSLRDAQSATIKQQPGRRATMVFADGSPGPGLIKIKAGWRLDFPAFCESLGMPVDDYLKQLRQTSKFLPDFADGVVNGKLKDPAALVAEITRRMK